MGGTAMKKSDMVRGMLFGAEFFTELHKEVVKLGGSEENMFEKMKTGTGLAKEVAKLIVTGAKTSIASFFKQDGPVKFWFGDNFKNWILSNIPDGFPEAPLSVKIILPKSMTDMEIMSEYKIRPYASVQELLSVLYDKFVEQPSGEDGELLNNGNANIFYVRFGVLVVAVSVAWSSSTRRWAVDASGLDGGLWEVGRCAFTRSSDV
jgi:hypothetical protein